MVHTEVYFKFKTILPSFAVAMVEYFPNGKNSIRVRMTSHRDYVFTYNGEDDWRFETLDSFVKSITKRKGA